jgi:hypothetical protein
MYLWIFLLTLEINLAIYIRMKHYKLTRESDGLTKISEEVKWFEWGLDGKFESIHEDPAIGRSLIMSPFNQFFTWQTTPITKIVKQKEGYIKFKTENSTYELFKL